MNKREIGAIIRERRAEQKISMYRMHADKISTVSQTGRLERGEANITIDRLISILDYLNLTLEVKPK